MDRLLNIWFLGKYDYNSFWCSHGETNVVPISHKSTCIEPFLFSSWYGRYGLIWISTTLVFLLAAFGNCATYLMEKHSDSTTSWSFDVSYVNLAAGSVYGYAIVVPVAFYFLLQYLGSNASLVRFWCLWGYSLFVFVLASVSWQSSLLFYWFSPSLLFFLL